MNFRSVLQLIHVDYRDPGSNRISFLVMIPACGRVLANSLSAPSQADDKFVAQWTMCSYMSEVMKATGRNGIDKSSKIRFGTELTPFVYGTGADKHWYEIKLLLH